MRVILLKIKTILPFKLGIDEDGNYEYIKNGVSIPLIKYITESTYNNTGITEIDYSDGDTIVVTG